MIIYSVKLSKRKIGVMLAVVAVFGFMTFVNVQAHQSNQVVAMETMELRKKSLDGISLKGGTEEEQLVFLKALGYECEAEPKEFCEIIIPPKFDGVYESYNEIQKGCGFDLSKYKEKRVKRYTYKVTNYGETAENVVANLLVYNKKIIGGDVCSLEMNGFMDGLYVIGD